MGGLNAQQATSDHHGMSATQPACHQCLGIIHIAKTQHTGKFGAGNTGNMGFTPQRQYQTTVVMALPKAVLNPASRRVDCNNGPPHQMLHVRIQFGGQVGQIIKTGGTGQKGGQLDAIIGRPVFLAEQLDRRGNATTAQLHQTLHARRAIADNDQWPLGFALRNLAVREKLPCFHLSPP
nr:hypothetical protein [uncultured Alcanivorax sp.]